MRKPTVDLRVTLFSSDCSSCRSIVGVLFPVCFWTVLLLVELCMGVDGLLRASDLDSTDRNRNAS